MKERRKPQRNPAITARTAARRYARALFDVAVKEKADLSHIDRELTSFLELLSDQPVLEKILTNPAVPAPRKKGAMAEMVRVSRISPIVGRLLTLLAERDRLLLMPDLVAAYRDRLLDHQNIVRAEVATAAPLSPDQARAIGDSLARATGRKVAVTTRVDPGIVGGLVAKVGGTVYDGSVTTTLRKIKERLRAAGA